MSSLVLELEYNEILSAETAVNLRNYIASRNSTLSFFKRAEIFADAVNRIVDNRIPRFSRNLAEKLKDMLFREIAIKPVFSINCADIFKAAIRLKNLSYEFFRELYDWLSGILKKAVTRESLFDYVIHAHRLMDSRPEDSLSNILEVVEESTGGLKYMASETVIPHVEAALEPAEEASSELFDYGGSIMEYIRTQNAAKGHNAGKAAPKKSDILGIIRKSILSVGPKRIITASALTAAALALVLFAGYRINAASNAKSAFDPGPLTTISNPVPENPAESRSIPEADTMRMRATAYDLSVQSCGKSPDHPQYGITSSGTRATVGRTVAVDPKVIPLGSKVYISFPMEYSKLDGVYIAEDTGRLIKGDSIDIFFGEDKAGSREVYESAMAFGVRYVDVRVLE